MRRRAFLTGLLGTSALVALPIMRPALEIGPEPVIASLPPGTYTAIMRTVEYYEDARDQLLIRFLAQTYDGGGYDLTMITRIE